MFKAAAAVATNNNVFYQQQILQNHLKNNFQKSDVSDVYFQNGKITSEYQQKPDNNIENTTESLQESNKLHIFKNLAYSLTFFKCYYCDDFHTNVEYDYEKHVITDHHDKPCYPSKADLEKLGLKAQGKSWETK